MVSEQPLYENKRFVTLVIVVSVAIAIFAMFSTMPVGQVWLKTLASAVMP